MAASGSSGSLQTSSSESGAAYSPQALARINALYPQLFQRFQQTLPQQSWSDFLSETGGPSVPFPEITMGGVYTPQQTQAGINDILARSAAGGAGQAARTRRQVAGRGFGAMSPLMQELEAQITGRARAEGQQQATGFSLESARMNADQLLRSQQAGVGRAAAMSEAELRRRQLAVARAGQGIERENALLNAMAQYNQPLPFSRAKSKGESWSSFGDPFGSSDQPILPYGI